MCLPQRNEDSRADVLLFFSHYDAQHRINTVSPLRVHIGKDEPVVGRFDAPVHQGLLGEQDPFRAAGVLHGDPPCLGRQNVLVPEDDLAGLCVDLIVIAAFPGVEVQHIAGSSLIEDQFDFGEHNFLRGFIQPGIFQSDLLCLPQRNEDSRADVLLFFSHYGAQHRINTVSPLRVHIGKDEPVVGRFDAPVHQGLLGEQDPFRAAGVLHGDPPCLGRQNVLVPEDDLAALCVDLIVIAAFSGVEVQLIAGPSLIAAQFNLSEHNFLRDFIQSGIFQGDLLCLPQRNEDSRADVLLFFSHYDAQHRINTVSPLRVHIGKDEPVVGRFDAPVHQGLLGEQDPFRAAGVLHGDPPCLGRQNVLVPEDDLAALCVDLIVIAAFSGVEVQHIAGSSLIEDQFDLGEHNFLRDFIQSGILQGDLLCFFCGDEP